MIFARHLIGQRRSGGPNNARFAAEDSEQAGGLLDTTRENDRSRKLP